MSNDIPNHIKNENHSGSDLIAEFIERYLSKNVFLVTGGACAFIVDAVGKKPTLEYTCFQHEQAAAMAADAVWRTRKEIGVTISTSGPGATNLITGIACSWFDSIPSFHITGQVNTNESSEFLGVKVRQAGFQETDIASMAQGITKFSKRVKTISDLLSALKEAYFSAISGRKGPVLLDIPMDVQKATIDSNKFDEFFMEMQNLLSSTTGTKRANPNIENFFSKSKRPLVLIGGGAVLGGSHKEIEEWCIKNRLPFVSSWAAMPSLNRGIDLYLGSIGVYGSRFANWTLQAADYILVFGSRLDNRQRTANANGFAPFARKLVIDIDSEELRKYRNDSSYQTTELDLAGISDSLLSCKIEYDFESWNNLISEARTQISDGFEESCPSGGLNPYHAVTEVQILLKDADFIVSDCGANLCWVYQAFKPSKQFLFTAGGNSPMGYSLPAAIGAQLVNRDSRVACFIGDGGMQMNIQELQTVAHYNLPIQIFIQNNFGYGIIKQFQDAYFEGRHFASGDGYSLPDFGALAAAYGIDYVRCSTLEDIRELEIDFDKPRIVDLILPQDALITPKVEMNRFLHDQFPYAGNNAISLLPFPYPSRPSELESLSHLSPKD